MSGARNRDHAWQGAMRCALLVAAVALAPAVARAQSAPADTSLHRFLDTLADSTDRYFGLITAPVDTAGLDSVLDAKLAGNWHEPRKLRPSLRPIYRFTRVDGSLWGGGVGLSQRNGPWSLSGDVGYTDGSKDWLGGGELRGDFGRDPSTWRVWVAGGRRSEPMNRDWDEYELAAFRALISGDDNQNWVRRDGFTAGVTHFANGWRAGFRYRDWLESPMRVVSTWNMAHRPLTNSGNLAATLGRVREIGLDGRTRVPGTQFRAQLGFRLADQSIGSDFDYRRTRAALSGDLGVGRHLSFVPQLAYGRLTGDAVPQASFYLGGPGTLRSIATESYGGTGLAVARLDLIGHDDLLSLVHIPHPSMILLQGALFAATGAVWGTDPFGGPGTPNDGWPDRSRFRSEAGVSLLYRPGIPDENAYVKVNVAWPVGPLDHATNWTITYSRALDLLKPF